MDWCLLLTLTNYMYVVVIYWLFTISDCIYPVCNDSDSHFLLTDLVPASINVSVATDHKFVYYGIL